MATLLYLLVVGILMQTSLLTADSRHHVVPDRRKNNPTSFNIGGVLSNRENMMFFKQTISVSTIEFKLLTNQMLFIFYGTKLHVTSDNMHLLISWH